MKFVAVAAVAALTLAGCSAPPVSDGLVHVVASTNVYGSIVSDIGGSLVSVTSIIDDAAQDPHSFEGSARVQLDLSRADVVVENGGGYDSFVDTLLAGVDNPDVKVLNVTELSGKSITADFNEHLWYDLPTIEKFVGALVPALAAASPANASVFEGKAEIFIERLASFEGHEANIAAKYGGTGVAMTEPVPGYLLEACGLVVVSSPEFSRAIEDGTDVAPTVLADTLALFEDGTAKLLVYNEQTTGPQTELVLTAARSAKVPVVSVTETMPALSNYLVWINGTIRDLEDALIAAHKLPTPEPVAP